MNRSTILIIILALFSLFTSCGRKRVFLYAEITGLPDGTVYLCTYEGYPQIVDSTQSAGGSFALPLPDTLPSIMYVLFSDRIYIPFVTDHTDISISGNYARPEEITVSGSLSNELLSLYRERTAGAALLLGAVEKAAEPYSDSTVLSDSSTYRTLLIKRDSLQRVVGTIREDFVAEYPSSIIAAMIAAGEVTEATPARTIDSIISRLDTANMSDNVFLQSIRDARRRAR